MPSLTQLSAQKNYVQYKLLSIVNKIHTRTQMTILSIIELITQVQMSLLANPSPSPYSKKRQLPLERQGSTSSDTCVEETLPNTWF